MPLLRPALARRLLELSQGFEACAARGGRLPRADVRRLRKRVAADAPAELVAARQLRDARPASSACRRGSWERRSSGRGSRARELPGLRHAADEAYGARALAAAGGGLREPPASSGQLVEAGDHAVAVRRPGPGGVARRARSRSPPRARRRAPPRRRKRRARLPAPRRAPRRSAGSSRPRPWRRSWCRSRPTAAGVRSPWSLWPNSSFCASTLPDEKIATRRPGRGPAPRAPRGTSA